MKKLIVLLLVLQVWFGSATYGFNGDLGQGTQPLTNGSAEYPFLIQDLADFNAFCDHSSLWLQGMHTELCCDLDLTSPVAYQSAPITSYEGSFNGNGHTISNLNVN